VAIVRCSVAKFSKANALCQFTRTCFRSQSSGKKTKSNACSNVDSFGWSFLLCRKSVGLFIHTSVKSWKTQLMVGKLEFPCTKIK